MKRWNRTLRGSAFFHYLVLLQTSLCGRTTQRTTRVFVSAFDFSEKFTTHVNDQQIVGSTDAYYCKDNPFSDYFVEVAKTNPPPPWEEFWQTILATGMVAKGEMWSREEEVRIIKKSPGVVLFEPPRTVLGGIRDEHGRFTSQHIANTACGPRMAARSFWSNQANQWLCS